MADLFDNVYTHCKSFNGAECINNGERCKFREGDGCKIENITGEVPILWDDEDRESIIRFSRSTISASKMTMVLRTTTMATVHLRSTI